MPAMPPDIDALKRAALGQVLFRAARLYNEAAIAEVQRLNPRARIAHTQLLPHLDAVGVRPTAIARKLGISKQAVGSLLAELEDQGVIERVPDPADRRAHLVRYTAKGLDGVRAGLGVLVRLAGELEATVGADRLARLHDDLTVLLAALENRA